jgi:serine protease
MHRFMPVLGAALVLVAACQETEPPTVPGPIPSLAQGREEARVIVVFNRGVQDAPGLAGQLTAQHGGTLRFTYQHAIQGFAASFPAAAVEGVRRNPNVAYVEPDAEVILFQTTQSDATWGLDRVDQRDLPLSGTYTYNNTGSGANVYILDTGVRRTHDDFGGRVQYVPNGANGDFVGDGHGSAEDCHGHGTHVAGTAAGATWGVAKSAPIWAARVVNCNGGGEVSMAIAAVDWVTANGVRPAVVNMSLGYGDVQSLRDAVENSIAAGVNYAVAAGNGSFPLGTPQDACNQSPAGAPNAMTVGATASNDTEASFSNYGTCVDILAPGVSITSAWHTSNTATNTISGTSMATPHVAGAIALYLTANPSASPGQVSQALKDNASLNKITLHSRSQSNGTPNRLLYTLFIGGGGDPGNQAPTAAFTWSCQFLACSFTDGSNDPDGNIVSWSWNFGGTGTSTQQNPSHTFPATGSYLVSLQVTDNDGATASVQHSVSVTAEEPPPSGFSLSAVGYKVRGVQHADLSWSGNSANVDVFRGTTKIATSVPGNAYTDNIGGRGGGSYTYRVCNTGTTTCSNEVTVTF